MTKAHDPITPGEILRTEFLEPLEISQYRLAQATGLSQTRIGRSSAAGDVSPRKPACDSPARLGPASASGSTSRPTTTSKSNTTPTRMT